MANLTQLRMIEGLDGLLLVDKPAGIAFATVVKAVKRKFGLVKVGHPAIMVRSREVIGKTMNVFMPLTPSILLRISVSS